jgi:hypothetical protein
LPARRFAWRPVPTPRILEKLVMELLLNLAWLLLVIPAFCLWRASTRGHEARQSRLVLLVLACTLAILFPVVSASDDIQAMRPEIEESSGRDVVRHSGHTRFFTSQQDLLGGRASLPSLAVPAPEFRAWGMIVPACCSYSTSAFLQARIGRSPPAPIS